MKQTGAINSLESLSTAILTEYLKLHAWRMQHVAAARIQTKQFATALFGRER